MNSPLFLLQQTIYMQLYNNIKDIDIFTHVPINTKLPYIHIAKIALKDISCKTSFLYKANIDIDIYSKDANYRSLFNITEATMLNLANNFVNTHSCKYQITSNRLDYCNISQQKDINVANLKFSYIISEAM